MKKQARFLSMAAATLLAAPVLTLVGSTAAHAADGPGATTPFTEYLAATQGTTTGTVLPVDYQYGSLQAEATDSTSRSPSPPRRTPSTCTTRSPTRRAAAG
jgi:hypothetical protein